jgi:hypothetical protein
MILLEIGLWDRLSSITAGKGFADLSPQKFRERVIEKSVPLLGLTMGTKYRDTTRVCLSGMFDAASQVKEVAEFTGHVDLYLAFKTQVVDRIGSCVV